MDPREQHLDETIVGGESTGKIDETIVNSSQPQPADATIGDSSAPKGLHDAAPQKPVDLQQYMHNLSAAGLFTAKELDELQKTLVDGEGAGDPDSFTDALLRKKALTPYQAEVLLGGKTRGLVLGNYVVLDKIGAGGMGMVFKARHRRMKRVVALKILPPELTNNSEVISRFHREVEAAAKLHHPNIAAAFDADEADGIHFLVMEIVEGPNLSGYVKKAGKLPLACALNLICQAARGLAHAHSQGVVHRDIKPGNLLINKKGVLKILDMGLAQLHAQAGEAQEELTELTQSGRVMGTVDYMAPEQAIDAKNVDHRADVYSLGCTLYYLLAGRSMSPDGALAQKLLWHQSEPAPQLGAVCDEVTEKIEAAFQKMMAKKPEDRQQSMAELVEQIDECLDELPNKNLELPGIGVGLSESTEGELTGAMHAGITMVERPTRTDLGGLAPAGAPAKPQSKRLVALGVVAALLIAAAGGGFFLFGGGGDDPPPAPPVAGGDNADNNNADNNNADNNNGGPVAVADAGGNNDSDAGGAPGAGTPAPPPPKPYESLLTWVFQNGGSAVIASEDGRGVSVSKLSDIRLDDYNLQEIDLSGASVRDDELQQLGQAKTLQVLSLADTAITDAGLAHLRDLEELGELNLEKTGVTNAGLEHLKLLLQLRDLRLQKTAVNDQGLQNLSQLSRLENLYLSDTEVGDVGARKLTGMQSLKRLVMNGTFLTEEGHTDLQTALKDLQIVWDGKDVERSVANKLLGKGVKVTVVNQEGETRENVALKADLPRGRLQIKSINADGALAFDDEDLQRAAELSSIESLHVGGTSITAAGLPSLYGLASLKTIDLGAAPIAAPHVGALKNALKECEISQKAPGDLLAARWVLENKGAVTVESSDGQLFRDLVGADDLPKGPFALRAIRINSGAPITDADIERLRDLSSLQSLDLAGAPIGDDGLANLTGCAALRELNLSGGDITSAALANLRRWPSLRSLYLADTAIDGEGLKSIARSAELTHLSLAGTKIVDADLAHLKRLEQLAQLDLSRTQLTDACLSHLQALSGLAELSIDGCKITDAGQEEIVAALADCSVSGDPLDKQRLAARWVLEQGGVVAVSTGELEKIDQLPRTACTLLKIDLAELPKIPADEFTAHIAGCGSLQELKLTASSVNDSQLAALAGVASLRRLELADTNVTDNGILHLADAKNLEFLDIRNIRVGAAGCSVLAKLPSLAHLYMGGSFISNRSLGRLQGATNLVSLDLGGSTLVSDAGLEWLSDLSQLKVLVLRNTRATDATLAKLAAAKDLTFLDLDKTKITDTGIAQLKELQQLTTLKLNNTDVSDSSGSVLGGLKNLKALSLVDTKFTEGGIASLQAALPECAIAKPRRRAETERRNRETGAGAGFGAR